MSGDIGSGGRPTGRIQVSKVSSSMVCSVIWWGFVRYETTTCCGPRSTANGEGTGIKKFRPKKAPPKRGLVGYGLVETIKNSLLNKSQTWAANSVLTCTDRAPDEPCGRNQIVCMIHSPKVKKSPGLPRGSQLLSVFQFNTRCFKIRLDAIK